MLWHNKLCVKSAEVLHRSSKFTCNVTISHWILTYLCCQEYESYSFCDAKSHAVFVHLAASYAAANSAGTPNTHLI